MKAVEKRRRFDEPAPHGIDKHRPVSRARTGRVHISRLVVSHEPTVRADTGDRPLPMIQRGRLHRCSKWVLRGLFHGSSVGLEPQEA